MIDYSSFYLASSGAAATLLGLLFIAIQFNIDAFATDPTNRWRATARSTFSIYVVLFALPLVLLIPGLSEVAQGWAIDLAAVLGVYRAFRTWWPVWRAALQHRRERWTQLLRLLVSPLVIYTIMIIDGYQLVQNQPLTGPEIGISLALAGLFVIALTNSWNLLVELTYEKKLGGPK